MRHPCTGDTDPVNQIKVEFNQDMVSLSSPELNADIFNLQCSASVQGSPRWANPKTWVYDFKTQRAGNRLPTGISCALQLKPNVKALPSNQDIVDKTKYSFRIDGPSIEAINPSATSYGGQRREISEDQIFAIQADADVNRASVLQNLFFTVAGFSNKVDAELIEDRKVISQIIHSQEFYLPLTPDKEIPPGMLFVRAKQLFTPEAVVTLVWGQGIQAASTSVEGAKAFTRARSAIYTYQVRKSFMAELTCLRLEGPKSHCSPLSPLTISFSSPVSAKFASQMRLSTGSDVRLPDLDSTDPKDKVVSVNFAPPFPAQGQFKIIFPKEFKDESGRSLSNVAVFPKTVQFADIPPLAKFNGNFGIIESQAKPVQLFAALRSVGELSSKKGKSGDSFALTGERVKIQKTEDFIKWINKISLRDESEDEEVVKKTQATSIFAGEPSLPRQAFNIPLEGPKSFQSVGIDLPEGKGFYVVELKSKILGRSLGDQKTMYIPTTALVTNLSLHLKWGPQSALVWVTALDTGKPVPGAQVQVLSCRGDKVLSGTADDFGVLTFKDDTLNKMANLSCKGQEKESSSYSWKYHRGFYVIATKEDDFSFTHSSWTEGIEPSRFGIAGSYNSQGSVYAHTILAQNLLKGGEVVHMKHVVRKPTIKGLELLKKDQLPTKVLIQHDQSGTSWEIKKLDWSVSSGTLLTDFELPPNAKLGSYSIYLVGGRASSSDEEGESWKLSGTFKVQDYKVPSMKGSIIIKPEAPEAEKNNFIRSEVLRPKLTVQFLNGGTQARLPGQFRYRFSDGGFYNYIQSRDFDGFEFAKGKVKVGSVRSGEDQGLAEEGKTTSVNFDFQNGAASMEVPNVGGANLDKPRTVEMDMEFRDPVGESYVVSRSVKVWPSAYVVGIRPLRMASAAQAIKLQAMVLDLQELPVSGQQVNLSVYKTTTKTTRADVVGSFHSYESTTTTEPASGVVAQCEGTTDLRGVVNCTMKFQPGHQQSGQFKVMAEVKDKKNRSAYSYDSVYVYGKDQWWFEPQDANRMDLISNKRRYNLGEEAEFTVRMPYKEASVLVTTEREGILHHEVLSLKGEKPTFKLLMDQTFAPNVFVSALAVRGRVEQPDDGEALQPGEQFLVDLNKPAFKMGASRVYVKWKDNELKVKVKVDRLDSTYKPQQNVTAKIQVTGLKQGNSTNSAENSGEVAIVVVDEGLLELQKNDTWNVLQAMMSGRSWDVTTATSQLQVVGKRHIGQKAVPHGGDGGSVTSTVRQLLDPLVLWNAFVPLAQDGTAEVTFPLNDSLTQFRIVAIAQKGAGQFGTGSTTITSKKDLILIPGQAHLARPGDQFSPEVTLQNTTDKPFALKVQGKVTFRLSTGETITMDLGSKEVQAAASDAQVVRFNSIQVPDLAVGKAAYQYEVLEGDKSEALDAVASRQNLDPVLIPRTQASELVQLADRPLSIPVEFPEGAVEGRGGVRVSLVDSLARSLDGVQEYFKNYTCTSFETQLSEAVATHDHSKWDQLMKMLPNMLVEGKLKWYESSLTGSLAFTSYVLSMAHEAGFEIPSQSRGEMLQALRVFVEGTQSSGRYTDDENARSMTPEDLLARRVNALHVLSKYEPIQADSINFDDKPFADRISALTWIELSSLYAQLVEKGRPESEVTKKMAQRFKETIGHVKARLTTQSGSMVKLGQDNNQKWWQMSSQAGDQAQLMLAALALSSSTESPMKQEWESQLPFLQQGLINMMAGKGSWTRTTSNVWASLAVRKFADQYEKDPVNGVTKVSLKGNDKAINWAEIDKNKGSAQMDFVWPEDKKGDVTLSHLGQPGGGRPWALVSSLAAMVRSKPVEVGLFVKKEVAPYQLSGLSSSSDSSQEKWTRGDRVLVTLKIKAGALLSRAALIDPIPSGAKIEKAPDWIPGVDYVEASEQGLKVFFREVDEQEVTIQYVMQLHSAGQFQMPVTRIEGIYNPDVFAEVPNPVWNVGFDKESNP